MKKIIFSSQYLNIKDTLECGQIFRFKPFYDGYLVFSQDKCAYCYNVENEAIIECNDEDEDYFRFFFDDKTDYAKIYEYAINSPYDIIKISAQSGKGIRILNQNKTENLISFLISQNNNIPRIKASIEKLCASLGEKKTFMGEIYFAFPTIDKLSNATLDFYSSIGLGYRNKYIYNLVKEINNGLNIDEFNQLSTLELNKKLCSFFGVGKKVADCVSLFGFHRTDSFPVDTWIEKAYRDNFCGNLSSPEQISNYLVGEFKEYSGYIQQYLFHYKRNLEKNLTK